MNDPTVFRRDCFKPNCATLFNQRDSAHGIPRSVLIDVDAVEGPLVGAAGPAIVPETIVVDHGKIYVSDHLTSVCQQTGISIQPARLRTGRDKGPVERFFRTIREDLLQALPGYKGPDVHSRGLDPESEAFFYLDELEAIIRESRPLSSGVSCAQRFVRSFLAPRPVRAGRIGAHVRELRRGPDDLLPTAADCPPPIPRRVLTSPRSPERYL